ncbi:DUF350 domain-containing protein [Clostridium botulinum]|uniref:DUF350 domain-containing protein n=1 Tax=Clostridium botulinum TaxID=1491 RepID=A0A0C2NWT4_CLOBO|nr:MULTISPECIES: DUF350 domain-containing protein [Clostridium]ACD51121.1 hypothetical protein CLH_1003 [Clostridium botulinum E3 str. Alaska E43]AJF29020.1 hypothetical protein ST13_04795 [Clostridium botulinum]AJF32081.1 hypothetical protein ST12_04795 [Clostridium botulinum]KAI3349079.1 DUF350 domain-containing protein [Clostridium botulinum]KIL09214.1 hypothetical protein SR42_09605 [Clostridium botulinum]
MHEILYNAGLSVTFGVVGIILLIIGYCAFDKVLTKIDFTEELKNKNIAVAIVIAGFMIAIGVIISGVVS